MKDDIFGDSSGHSLEGKYFHTWVDGEIEKQGVVVSVFNSNLDVGQVAVVQFFSWSDGRPTQMRMVRLTDLLTDVFGPDKITFYDSTEDMDSAANKDAD